METYVVGGAVRDELLGLPVTDRDFVVVGATVQQMLDQGFVPVGRDFPVFLHPRTHEEYALARTERKSGSGYRGFVVHADPAVTLEEDLARRDLTVNAMARAADGRLIDPWGGEADLAARVFRHVGPAFVEDPVRILRVARFMARFTQFSIAPQTLGLMRRMVDGGEVDHLVAERVWQEFARGLMTERPSRMIAVLRECGALARLMPEIDALFGVAQNPTYHPEIDAGVHSLLALDSAARMQAPLAVRFAALVHDAGKALTPAEMLPEHPQHEMRGEVPVRALCDRLRVPGECRDMALLVTRCHGEVHGARRADAQTRLRLLERLDAFRRPERFEHVLLACKADACGRPGHEHDAFTQAELLRTTLARARAVPLAELAAAGDPREAGARIHAARLVAIERPS